MVALLDDVYPSAPDPATGREYGRMLVGPDEAIRLLGWGPHGMEQGRDALSVALEIYGVKQVAVEPLTL